MVKHFLVMILLACGSVSALATVHYITPAESNCPAGEYQCSNFSSGTCCGSIKEFMQSFPPTSECLNAGDEIRFQAGQRYQIEYANNKLYRLRVQACPNSTEGKIEINVYDPEQALSRAKIYESVNLSAAGTAWAWSTYPKYPRTDKVIYEIQNKPIYQIDVSGIAQGRKVNEFYYAGDRMMRARHEHGNAPGYHTTKTLWNGTCSFSSRCTDMAPGGCYSGHGSESPVYRLNTYAVDENDIYTDPDVYVVLRSQWDVLKQRVANVCNNTQFKTDTTIPRFAERLGNGKDWGFYVYNSLAFLDSPGEWYYDSFNQYLYFWPPANPKETNGSGVAPTLIDGELTFDSPTAPDDEYSLNADLGGSSHSPNIVDLRIANIDFYNAARGAVRVHGWGRDVEMLASRVLGSGIRLINMTGLMKLDSASLEVKAMAGDGISVDNVGDIHFWNGTIDGSPTPACADGCSNIRNVASFWIQPPNSWSNAMNGLRISNTPQISVATTNISNIPYAAIILPSWYVDASDRLETAYIGNNTITNYCGQLNDCGGLYISGMRVVNNTIHSETNPSAQLGRNIVNNTFVNGGTLPVSTPPAGTPPGYTPITPAIYLDFHASSWAMYDNTVIDSNSDIGDIFFMGGNYNRVHDNSLTGNYGVGLTRWGLPQGGGCITENMSGNVIYGNSINDCEAVRLLDYCANDDYDNMWDTVDPAGYEANTCNGSGWTYDIPF